MVGECGAVSRIVLHARNKKREQDCFVRIFAQISSAFSFFTVV